MGTPPLRLFGIFATALALGGLSGCAVRAPAPPSDRLAEATPRGIVSHALWASVEPPSAGLHVIDTLTIQHPRRFPASDGFCFLLAESLSVVSLRGIDLDVEFEERPFRPRDYWESPPYDRLTSFGGARTIVVRPAGTTKPWPEQARIVVEYSGAVYDSLRAPRAAYSRGFETTSGLIDPRGAFLSGGTFWVPTRPDERFLFRCVLETPADWYGISQGALEGSSTAGERRATGWDCPHPMEEIYLIAGPYALRQETRRGVEVMTFTYASTDEALCRRYIDGTERYLELYDEKIGPYPFAKFALIENFWQTGFGMPSFTLLGDQVIRLPFILDTSFGHEILHNWWGNGVFVDYETGNWCEGLTTYGADYLYKERQGPSEAKDYRRTSLQGYLDYVSDQEDFPLRQFVQREDYATQAIGYAKSMMVFHQVRRLLGEEEFWNALQDVYRDFKFRRASWEDIFAAFSRRADRDLGAWKGQWIDRTGAPALALKSHDLRPSAGGGVLLDVVVEQRQPDLFDLLVPVRVGWNDGTPDRTEVISLSQREGSCPFELRAAPDWIAVDPDFDVLRRIEPAEIPPALSRTLGADTACVVIASTLSPDLREAYGRLAGEWSKGARLAVLAEEELAPGQEPGIPTWYFGLGERARSLAQALEENGARHDPHTGGWEILGEAHAGSRGFVLAGGPPDRPELAWSLLSGSSADQIAALGRKVPHYGKYGFLVFEGSQNVAKGSWEVRRSPLRVELGESGGEER